MTSQENQPTITLNDLVLVCNIIQAASSRGAFKAEELSSVGGCYDRLVTYLTASGAFKPAETPADPGTQA
jgi:hypothetical protein